MSSQEDQIDKLREAKDAFRAEYGDCGWFRGVGIGTTDSGLVLRVNVDPGCEVQAEVPTEFRGCRVEVVRIEGYGPRD